MQDLTTEESWDLLTALPVAHIATVSDGVPYVTPISYVVSDERLYFRTGPGRRLDEILAQPQVCIEASTYDEDTGEWESVIIWGRASMLEDGGKKAEVVALLLEKYRRVMGSPLSFSVASPSPFEDDVIVEVATDEISGRSSGRGFAPRTRPGRL